MELKNDYDCTKDVENHRILIEYILNVFVDELKTRIYNHDNSKLYGVEKELFDRYTPKLKSTTFMSKEYKDMLEELKPALDSHYKLNWDKYS